MTTSKVFKRHLDICRSLCKVGSTTILFGKINIHVLYFVPLNTYTVYTKKYKYMNHGMLLVAFMGRDLYIKKESLCKQTNILFVSCSTYMFMS